MHDLSQLNRRGLIPGPEESEEIFFERCERALPHEEPASSPLVKKIYDIDPDWVSIRYSNKNLHPWEGGCTWIENNQATLQLKKVFEKRKKYLGLYSREELIAHELVHVARQAFEEPVFEEVLAYHLSPSPFRRFFGPVFRSSKEVIVLLCSVVATFFTTLALPVFIGVLGGGFVRLWRAQRLFRRTRHRLSDLVGKERALAVMLRLTDREITRFATMTPQQITQYAKKLRRTSLRWKQLTQAYNL